MFRHILPAPLRRIFIFFCPRSGFVVNWDYENRDF